jgi:hypothetical protein
MTPSGESVAKPEMLHMDDGGTVWLGDPKAAREAIDVNYSLEPEGSYVVEGAGWMWNEGWDRDNYRLKREYVEETGCTSYWGSCPPPANGIETRKRRRAWRVRWVG